MDQISTQNVSLLCPFGSPSERVAQAVAALRAGRGVLVVDDEDRENEGDFVFAAETLTPQQMAVMIREGSGIVCLCLEDEALERLNLPQMVARNTSRNGTAFTVSIEAKSGVSTGVSAADRTHTIRTAVAEGAKADDLVRPGHVFPLRAQPGGVLTRPGHTEASVDLCKLAGLKPAGVLCEMTNPDGTMARLPEIAAYAQRSGMPVVAVADVVACRQALLNQCAARP